MYDFATVNRLRPGQYFQFIYGVTINQVVHIERNLLVYTNVITGKSRRLTGFCEPGNDIKKITYCKVVDNMFKKYHENMIDLEMSPF